MDLNIQITDMAGAGIEHSMVIMNFCTMAAVQLKNSMCRVFPDNVQYKWQTKEGREKMELYKDQEINEYWIVDWRKSQVEIYDLVYDETDKLDYHLWNVVTQENKKELKLIHFPHLDMDFDELFNLKW